jgi:hypothetical protein
MASDLERRDLFEQRSAQAIQKKITGYPVRSFKCKTHGEHFCGGFVGLSVRLFS